MGIWGRSVEDLVAAFRGKRVFVTGHTGFKGAWLCAMLEAAGAHVTGYALEPPTDPSLFELSHMDKHVNSCIGDIRDYNNLLECFNTVQPQIVFHLSAQPIVRASYEQPRYTYETNVMGTVNILECVRQTNCVQSFLNVTTDKVYLNEEKFDYAYREDDKLDGFDPYSNSKSCSELVTHSYAASFFAGACGAASGDDTNSCTRRQPSISTARAGNVIGGGDFADMRIIPDCVRAYQSGEEIIVRNPNSVRPYQHVLEPLYAYMLIAAKQIDNPHLAGWYNVGPDDCDCISTGELCDLWCSNMQGAKWKNVSIENDTKHEANYLKLDNTKIKETFGWQPRWNVKEAVAKTAQWTRTWLAGEDVYACMKAQIKEFLNV